MGDLETTVLERYGTPETAAIQKDVDQLSADIEQMQRGNYTAGEIRAAKDTALRDLQIKHWAAARGRFEAGQEKLAKEQAAWEKAADKNAGPTALKVQRHQAKARMLSDDALTAAAESYGADIPDADYLEALVGEMRARKLDLKADAMVKQMEASHYAEPWRHTARGGQILAEMELADTGFGEFAILAKGGEDGDPGQVLKFKIEDLI